MSTILVTGASGVLGSALLPLLSGHRVIALTHRAPVHAESVSGDLTQPKLGLDSLVYRRLCGEVDLVVHSAGVVDFTADSDALHRLNMEGTQRVTEFCRDAGARLVHVSTAFVDRAPDAAGPENYLVTKRAGEEVVRDSGVPCAVVRPSIIIGDSVTGKIARIQGLHWFAASVLRNQIPFMAMDPLAPIDVVPQDVVAEAIRAIVDNGVEPGLHWVTGSAASVSCTRLIEVIAGLGVEVVPPPFLPAEMMDRLIRPAFYELFPRAARRRMDELLALMELFGTTDAFPTDLGRIPGGPAALTRTDVEEALRTSFRHLAPKRRKAVA